MRVIHGSRSAACDPQLNSRYDVDQHREQQCDANKPQELPVHEQGRTHISQKLGIVIESLGSIEGFEIAIHVPDDE